MVLLCNDNNGVYYETNRLHRSKDYLTRGQEGEYKWKDEGGI